MVYQKYAVKYDGMYFMIENYCLDKGYLYPRCTKNGIHYLKLKVSLCAECEVTYDKILSHQWNFTMINPHVIPTSLKENEFPVFECDYGATVTDCQYYNYDKKCVKCKNGYYPNFDATKRSVTSCQESGAGKSYDLND